ncbi:immune-induced peptides-like isoform X2 [Drosophila novamexicana]|uniref:immune-induced peptides-like isoform X2 n=1 Tax=Drosophila novamexicana TaxID=47314 RepID=UPI0011E5A903|nr:immune-induced peptides-like isoform X2 [Drosophila novamexicana]
MLKELSGQIIRGIGNMESQAILGLSLLCIVGAQSTYDGSSGPHVLSASSQPVLIRGQNEVSYQVPSVAGTFQNTPGSGSHSYTDERGNTYVHNMNGAGNSATQHNRDPTVRAYRGTRSVVVSRPNRDVAKLEPSFGSSSAHSERECFDVEKPRTKKSSESVQIAEDGKIIKSSEYLVEIERVCLELYYTNTDLYINSK